MLIDALVQHFTHGRQRYDKDARLAHQGHLHRGLLARLLRDPYFKVKPPKSTGREYFGAAYVKKFLALGGRHKLKPTDLIHTVTVFTAASIADALHRFVLPKHKITRIVVSGGGAHNPLLFEQLSLLAATGLNIREFYAPPTARIVFLEMALPNPEVRSNQPTPDFQFIPVESSVSYGIPADAKEALAFAILAYETFHQRPSNLPSATGARGPAILGKVSYAPPR